MLGVVQTCGATACQPSVCSTVPRAAASAISSRSSWLTTRGTAAYKVSQVRPLQSYSCPVCSTLAWRIGIEGLVLA